MLSFTRAVALLLALSLAGHAQWTTIKTFKVSSSNFGDMSCPDKNTCFVVGNNGIYKTANGGTTWDSLGANGLAGPYIWFTDANKGFACGANGGIWVTKNAGVSWTAVRDINTGDGCQAYMINDIFFPTRAAGYAVGQFGAVLRTLDSGATWTCSIYNGPGLNAVFFTDSANGWAVGVAGRIMHTANGGTSWSSQISGTSEALGCVYFTSNTTGFAAGGGTSCVLTATTNAGTGWNLVATGISGTAKAMWFTSDKVGYIATTGGVYRTQNSGTTWTLMTGGLANPTTLCFPDDVTGYEVSSSGSIAKYNGTGVLLPVAIKSSAGFRVFYDAKGIVIQTDKSHIRDLTVSLFDLRGRNISRVTADASCSMRIPTANLGSGMYLLKLNIRSRTSYTFPVLLP